MLFKQHNRLIGKKKTQTDMLFSKGHGNTLTLMTPWCVQVMDLRHLESQVMHEEAPSEQGSSMVGHGETSRNRGTSGHGGPANTDTSPMYNFNLSFEELSNVGLDELQRNPNPPWMVSLLFNLWKILFSFSAR